MAAKRTAPDNRVRTKNLVIRLSDRERSMLDAVAERESFTISETIRWLVRREFEAAQPTPKAKGKK